MLPKPDVQQTALRVIAEAVTIPTLPSIVQRINRLASDPKVGLVEIGAVVAQDAPMTSRVLRIANSAYYGLQEPVLSAEQAATVVGARAMQSIALQASVMQHYDHLAGTPDFDLSGIWRHAILTAQLCQLVGKERAAGNGLTPEELYTCGLLHDIGKVVLLDSLGEEYLQVFRDARDKGRAIHVSEKELLGYTHTDVGSLVAVRWDFPEGATRAIRFHHGPRVEIETDPCVAAVAVADQIAYRVQAGGGGDSMAQLAALAERSLGMDGAAFRALVAHAVETLPSIEL